MGCITVLRMWQMMRTCQPGKPDVGLTRQFCCPERTMVYYKEALRECDRQWFNWQLRTTTFHVKNYRNQRKQWTHLIQQMLTQYRIHSVVTYHILSYLPYEKLPKLYRFVRYTLDYTSMDISRVFRMMTEKLVSLGYPRVECEPSEMDVYLSYYSSSSIVPIDMDFFRHLYCMLQAKKIGHMWRIIYSHMMMDGLGMSSYSYKEGYLNTLYSSERSDHYFKLWLENTQLDGEPLVLVKSWFSRMKHPSLRV